MIQRFVDINVDQKPSSLALGRCWRGRSDLSMGHRTRLNSNEYSFKIVGFPECEQLDIGQSW